MICVVFSSTAETAPSATAQAEIDALIARIAASGCEFNRNGTWYDSTRAAAHLKAKYAAMVPKDVVASAEDFIERTASRSSMSGADYLIRCPGVAPVTSGKWLRDQLNAARASRPSISGQ